MKLSFLYLLLFLNLIGTGCSHKVASTQGLNNFSFFIANNLGRSNKSKNITIHTVVPECGEWGGHEENIIINADTNEIFHANYKVYSYNCDTAYNLGHDSHIRLIKDTIIVLDTAKQQSLKNYIYEILEAKITEKLVPHYGCYFSVASSDSSIVLISKNCNPMAGYYRQLVLKLFSPQ